MSWWCGTESKAFFTSKKTAATCWFFASSWCQEFVTERRASCVEERGLKPNWQWERRLFEYKKLEILEWMILSRTLETSERSEIGR